MQSEEESVVDDFDFDDDEGSDHQDYDANYFDNGEGDDDSGGEEGECRSGNPYTLLRQGIGHI